jgi:hypothetical protein
MIVPIKFFGCGFFSFFMVKKNERFSHIANGENLYCLIIIGTKRKFLIHFPHLKFPLIPENIHLIDSNPTPLSPRAPTQENFTITCWLFLKIKKIVYSTKGLLKPNLPCNKF